MAMNADKIVDRFFDRDDYLRDCKKKMKADPEIEKQMKYFNYIMEEILNEIKNNMTISLNVPSSNTNDNSNETRYLKLRMRDGSEMHIAGITQRGALTIK